MPAVDEDVERVNAFRVDDRYLFRHYFDEAVFDLLARYYDNQGYRFEVPSRRFEPLQVTLRDRGYDLSVVDDPAAYAVVVRKYRDHPENVFKAAVVQRGTERHNVFVLRDKRSVALAVKQGATRLVDADVDVDLGVDVDETDRGEG